MERLEAGMVPIHTSNMTPDGRIFGISILEEIPKEIANFCCSSIHDEEDEHSYEDIVEGDFLVVSKVVEQSLDAGSEDGGRRSTNINKMEMNPTLPMMAKKQSQEDNN